MAGALPTNVAATTPDERMMAVLAQVLQLIGGWIAPLVIFLVKRQSRFVSFHALQVLLFEILCVALTMLVMGAVFVGVILSITFGSFPLEHGAHNVPPLFLAVFAAFWLAFVLIWFVKLLLAIVYGVKAGQGEWAEYPVLGRYARKILNLEPGGVVASP